MVDHGHDHVQSTLTGFSKQFSLIAWCKRFYILNTMNKDLSAGWPFQSLNLCRAELIETVNILK